MVSSLAILFPPSHSVLFFQVRPYLLFHAAGFGFTKNNFGEIADLSFQKHKLLFV